MKVGRDTLPQITPPERKQNMQAKQIMVILNRLTARRDRQAAALENTQNEVTYWEAELKKVTDEGKKKP